MHKWNDVVLKPWKDAQDVSNPSAEPPNLVVDVYCIHQIASVVNLIQSMGIEVVHIPADCTY
jgi:hypothetical protein